MAHAWATAKKSGGAQSQFVAALSKDDRDTDNQAGSDGDGANEPMDEDEASVASSQGDT